jgi:hypothetical protein
VAGTARHGRVGLITDRYCACVAEESAEVEAGIAESVATSVLAGVAEPGTIVADTVDRWYCEGIRRQWVRAVAWSAVTATATEQFTAQRAWPDVTDNDRLATAFRTLEKGGILARERLGISLSDGWALIRDAHHEVESARGAVFYHEQDLQGAVRGSLMLAFGGLGDHSDAEIGAEIAAVLREHGLTVDWDGDPQRRICVAMRWQARLPGDPAAVAPPPGADFRPSPASGPTVGWAGLAARKETVTDWLRARHAAGEIVCADADGHLFEPTAPVGGYLPAYLIGAAVMAERGIDDRQFIDLVTSGNLGPSDWGQEVERLCGVPPKLLYALISMFAALPAEDRADFAVEAVSAIPVGADLTPVCDRWFLDLLDDPAHGVLRNVTHEAQVATEAVAAGLRRRLAGDDLTDAEWSALANAAYGVSAYAAFFATRDSAADTAKYADRETDSGPNGRRWQARRLIERIVAA